MDVIVKMARFQIKQNVLIGNTTLSSCLELANEFLRSKMTMKSDMRLCKTEKH